MTLEEAIKTALYYEAKIRDLYQEASVRIPHAMGRRIMEALRDDEQHHLDYLEDRLREWQKTGEISKKILETKIPSGKGFKEDVKKVEKKMAGDPLGDQAQMLSRALHLEMETSQFYERMVRELSGDGREMFARFLEIEQAHINAVQAELDYLSRTGYWFDMKEFDME